MSLSTFSGLNVALRGLLAQQRALDVTTHNIANANTEGYSRQTAVMVAAEPLANVSLWGMMVPGQIGQGVSVEAYQRIRDVFTDTQLRGQLGEQARQEVAYRELSGVELAFPEPGPDGLQAIMSKFWATWQDVASNPENLGARQALAQQGEAMAAAFRDTAKTLADMRANVNVEIGLTPVTGGSSSGAIGEVNSIATRVADLNNQIHRLVVAGQSPNDLLDHRDRLLDDLAGFGNITVTYAAVNPHRAHVTIGGLTIVDASAAGDTTAASPPLSRDDFDGAFTAAPATITSGRLHALLESYHARLDPTATGSFPSQLDTLAYSLQDALNTQHALGTELDGTNDAAGADFFATTPASAVGAAAALRINAALVAQPTLIRARASSENGPGSNGNALAIINLRTQITTGGSTFDEYYTGLVTGLGVNAQEARRGLDATDIVVASLQGRRDQSSGVSLDEEMANMIRFQHAFAAASRVLSAMDDNLNRLINSTGRVGI